MAFGLFLGVCRHGSELRCAALHDGVHPAVRRDQHHRHCHGSVFGVADITPSWRANRAGAGAAEADPVRACAAFVPRRGELAGLGALSLRGSGIGSVIGALPGAGPSIASFMALPPSRKRVSRTPGKFGKGPSEGVAAPKPPTTHRSRRRFIPTLSLGIPGDVVMAVLLGAMMMHGGRSGPRVSSPREPAMFWGLIVSFWIGQR